MVIGIPKIVRDILFAGTKDLKTADQTRPVVIINTLALLTAILVLIVGSFFYLITSSSFILAGVLAECLTLTLVIWCNKKVKHDTAKVLTLLVHCIFGLYFGAILGDAMPVELITTFLLAFLVGASVLVYKQWAIRLICFFSTIVLFLVVTANNHYQWVEPVEMSQSVRSIIKTGSWIGMIILIAAMMFLIIRQSDNYIREIDRLINELKKANNAKRNFLQETTHEIRSPLNSVLGYTQLLNAKHPEDEHIKRLLTATIYCGEVINNVLDLAKIEADKYDERNITSFSLSVCLRTCINMSMFIANDRHINVECSLDPDLPEDIQSDRLFFTKILNNLLTNAVKFGTYGSEVVIRVWRRRDRLNFSVANQADLDDSRIARMFETFESERNEQHQGTGLGLQINKKLIELLEGQIRAEKEGKNIIFQCELPFFYDDKYDKAQAPAIKDHSSLMGNAFKGYKILFVEDHEMNYQVLEDYLLTTGADIIGMNTGEGVAEKAKATQPDLIILDARLPGATGLEVARQLKAATSSCRHIPILVLSGDVFDKAMELFFEAGVNAYMLKPFLLPELEQTIVSLLPIRILSSVNQPIGS